MSEQSGRPTRTRRDKGDEPNRPKRRRPGQQKPEQHQDRTRKPRRPTDKDVRTKAAKLDGMVDLHIRCGLEDSVVRIKVADYSSKITLGWMLRRQDIVFRSQLESSETVIVLRGTDNARLRLTAASQGKKLAFFHVYLADELREKMLAGLEKPDSPK